MNKVWIPWQDWWCQFWAACQPIKPSPSSFPIPLTFSSSNTYTFFPSQVFAWANFLCFSWTLTPPFSHQFFDNLAQPLIHPQPYMGPSILHKSQCLPLRALMKDYELRYLAATGGEFSIWWHNHLYVCTCVHDSCVHMPVLVFCGCYNYQ